MSRFSFYINVDKCLNMSYYDMFTYKLQKKGTFQYFDVNFDNKKEEQDESLADTFHRIRNHLDNDSIAIGDFRLIFGINRPYNKQPAWSETLLYQKLKIYFGLKKERIDVRGGRRRKSVDIVMLYDVDAVGQYIFEDDSMKDVQSLMDYLNISIDSFDSDESLAAILDKILSEGTIYREDPLTALVLKEYLKWWKDYSRIRPVDPASQAEFENNRSDEELDEYWEDQEWEESQKETQEELGNSNYRKLDKLVSYFKRLIGSYGVFFKEVDNSDIEEQQLAKLSLVDFITAELRPSIESMEGRTTIREQTVYDWENAKNDQTIKERYGLMLSCYKQTLGNALSIVDQKIGRENDKKEITEYKKPSPIEPSSEQRARADENTWKKTISKVIDDFKHECRKKMTAEASWKKTYLSVKEKLDELDRNLLIIAQELSSKYKEELDERKREEQNQKIIDREDCIYNRQYLNDIIDREDQERKKILKQLESPVMNPSLTLQDRMNMEEVLEECNREISFYLRCQRMVVMANFMMTVLVCAGLYGGHYLLLQSFVFQDIEKLGAFLGYFLVTAGLFLLCYRAPWDYLRKKIFGKLDQLEEQAQLFIRGYFEKIENFKAYINTLNELDAINGYLEQVNKFLDSSDRYYQKLGWHRSAIAAHIGRVMHFRRVTNAVDYMEVLDDNGNCYCELNPEEDIIHNELYCPQRRGRGETRW